jgi:DNA-binding phage protein
MNMESKASTPEEAVFVTTLFQNFLANYGFRLTLGEKDHYARENPEFKNYLTFLGELRGVSYSTSLRKEWHEFLTEAAYPVTPDAPEKRAEKEIDPILKQGVAMNRALLGNLIKSYIKDNDLTITALAVASGVSREQIGWLITGNRDPRLNTLLRVLVAMKNTLLIEVED